ncbi:MAG TPA: DNA-3-methyladenine glycosylase I [Alphaproteobacteria bacterium]|nr:DNA-3-methyladenine glycosylase I [Alphaproteobacteria bacterium]
MTGPRGSETRCSWSTGSDLMIAYHDEEWGVPERDDRALFEKLILDGFQAGLSWSTILNKRENFRRAFDRFDPQVIARYAPKKLESLMNDAGIVRNRSKITASVTNAQAWLEIMETGPGSFADFLWQFTDGEPIRNAWDSWRDVPAETTESKAMSKALKARGFRFCGPTICYAFMQAVGMVNDHVVTCFRHHKV